MAIIRKILGGERPFPRSDSKPVLLFASQVDVKEKMADVYFQLKYDGYDEVRLAAKRLYIDSDYKSSYFYEVNSQPEVLISTKLCDLLHDSISVLKMSCPPVGLRAPNKSFWDYISATERFYSSVKSDPTSRIWVSSGVGFDSPLCTLIEKFIWYYSSGFILKCYEQWMLHRGDLSSDTMNHFSLDDGVSICPKCAWGMGLGQLSGGTRGLKSVTDGLKIAVKRFTSFPGNKDHKDHKDPEDPLMAKIPRKRKIKLED